MVTKKKQKAVHELCIIPLSALEKIILALKHDFSIPPFNIKNSAFLRPQYQFLTFLYIENFNFAACIPPVRAWNFTNTQEDLGNTVIVSQSCTVL
jgi:hypothetical protein